MTGEMASEALKIGFNVIMTICIPWAIYLGIKTYAIKKYSRLKVAKNLILKYPKNNTFSLNELEKENKNAYKLRFFYYWLLFAEIFILLFLFVTLCFTFFGFLPVLFNQITSKSIIIALIIIEIIFWGLAYFFKVTCKELGSKIDVNMNSHW